ncbi:zinc-dependent alcohol dehydrogenase family protein [Rhodopila sp.]|uniref:zinc-dependent alcohol dehydrogenase family protein n=1 Tax=Rhodopila sp. TaxID=2480087 RepID=UPI003D11F51D
MSKVVRFHELGGPEVLKLEDESPRQPGSGEAQVEVRAIGLNRAEAMFRRGIYLEQPSLPSRIGYEISGVVRAVGPDVTSFKPGDAVSTIPGYSQGKYGACAEVALVPADVLVAKPEALSFEQAASIWMQYMTAYGALIDIAHLGRGDAVVIAASSSSVGLAAIQIARHVGATPIATTRTGAKRAALLEAGAATVIATEEDDVPAAIMAATDGKGARVVFDPVGGRMVLKLAAGMAQSGILFQYGGLSGEETPFPTMASFANRLSMRAYSLMEIIADPARRASGVDYVLDGLKSGALTPKIAKTFTLDQIVEAYRYLEGNEQIGKIVVTV